MHDPRANRGIEPPPPATITAEAKNAGKYHVQENTDTARAPHPAGQSTDVALTHHDSCHQTKPRQKKIKRAREMRTGALGLGDDGLAELAGREGGRGLDVVPLLLGEGVNTEKWRK